MSTDLSTLRRQLQQLKELNEAGVISAEQFEESRAPLERRVVELVMAGATELPVAATASAAVAAAANETRKVSRWLLAGIAVVVVAIAAGGYYWSGHAEQIVAGSESGTGAATAGAPDGKPHEINAAQIEKMVDGLASKLKENPNDAVGWGMLARSYVHLGKFKEAAAAYQQAVKLTPNDASLLADYADTLAETSGSLEGEPIKWVEKALKLDPNNLGALELSANAAYNRKDYGGAVKFLEKMIQVGPKEAGFIKQVGAKIEAARQIGKLPPSKAVENATAALSTEKPVAASIPGGSISGRVSLSPALAKLASPDDTLFISARAVSGSPMPLAIVRKQVKDLPFDFSLDDSNSMSPDAKLSNAQKVLVVARISKSGQAMTQPGDLRGQSEPVSVGASKLNIEIGELVK
jgi:cytochrome c-type biogenesis protein CcmH